MQAPELLRLYNPAVEASGFAVSVLQVSGSLSRV